MRIATSLISVAQAKRNLWLEIADDDTFETVRERAAQAWDERLGQVEVEGATEDQLVTLYSNLYRLHLYPNRLHENTGTADAPAYAYASPFTKPAKKDTPTQTGATLVSGKAYVNNGFWDTYRTAWPALRAARPGPLRRADRRVRPAVQGQRLDRALVGPRPRRPDDRHQLRRRVRRRLRQGRARLRRPGRLRRRAAQRDRRPARRRGGPQGAPAARSSLGYTRRPPSTVCRGHSRAASTTSASPASPGCSATRTTTSTSSTGPSTTSTRSTSAPASSRAARTTAAGATPPTSSTRAPGVATTSRRTRGTPRSACPTTAPASPGLHGGRHAMAAKLDEFFAVPETGRARGKYWRAIHEMAEARDVRMGQYGHSNQPSHHIPYMYAYTGALWRTQEKVREVLARLYAGSEIGQGYYGDEDNGEMSAWWLFSALGLLPAAGGQRRVRDRLTPVPQGHRAARERRADRRQRAVQQRRQRVRAGPAGQRRVLRQGVPAARGARERCGAGLPDGPRAEQLGLRAGRAAAVDHAGRTRCPARCTTSPTRASGRAATA